MREEYSNFSVPRNIVELQIPGIRIAASIRRMRGRVICAVTVEKHVFLFTEVQFKTNCRCNAI